jgi:hypothetical protein
VLFPQTGRRNIQPCTGPCDVSSAGDSRWVFRDPEFVDYIPQIAEDIPKKLCLRSPNCGRSPHFVLVKDLESKCDNLLRSSCWRHGGRRSSICWLRRWERGAGLEPEVNFSYVGLTGLESEVFRVADLDIQVQAKKVWAFSIQHPGLWARQWTRTKSWEVGLETHRSNLCLHEITWGFKLKGCCHVLERCLLPTPGLPKWSHIFTMHFPMKSKDMFFTFSCMCFKTHFSPSVFGDPHSSRWIYLNIGYP